MSSICQEVAKLYGYRDPTELNESRVSLKWGTMKKKDSVDLLLVGAADQIFAGMQSYHSWACFKERFDLFFLGVNSFVSYLLNHQAANKHSQIWRTYYCGGASFILSIRV